MKTMNLDWMILLEDHRRGWHLGARRAHRDGLAANVWRGPVAQYPTPHEHPGGRWTVTFHDGDNIEEAGRLGPGLAVSRFLAA